MCNPCDVSICDPSKCHDSVCMATLDSLDEPSVGFVYEPKCQECISLFCPDRNGPDAYACTKQQKE